MSCDPRTSCSFWSLSLTGFLLLALTVGCSSTRGPIAELEDVAVCELARSIFARSMDAKPLFEAEGDNCTRLRARRLDTPGARSVFADPACTIDVAYGGESWRTFCDQNVLGNDTTRNTIGNPDAWSNLDPEITDRIETRWLAAQDVRLRLAAVNQTRGLRRPYLKRVEYRRVGECALGMHVYREDLAATDLKPLMLLHGGGWKYRGLGAVAGQGTMAPHFTSRGYVVFAPFYRLLEDSDGPEACQGVTGKEILADIDAAFEWVRANGSRYGMRTGGPIAVAGQSAGGHLAAYLATYRPDDVDRGLLLYPAPDLGFVAENVKPGGLYAEGFDSGKRLLLSFFDQPAVTVARDLDPADPEIARNSFPPVIQQDPGRYPPLETVHGDADSTVPVEVSVRLCQALDLNESPSTEGYAGGGQVRSCGSKGGRLTVVAGADHILDLRCFSGRATALLTRLAPELEALCTAGSKAGERTVRSTLTEAYDQF